MKDRTLTRSVNRVRFTIGEHEEIKRLAATGKDTTQGEAVRSLAVLGMKYMNAQAKKAKEKKSDIVVVSR